MSGGPRIYCDSRYCPACGMWEGYHRRECPEAAWNKPEDEGIDSCEAFEKERLS